MALNRKRALEHLERAREVWRSLTRCGAYARTTGLPCRQVPIRGRNRCRLHGGKAGRPIIHGMRSKAYIQEQRDLRDMLRAIKEWINS